MMRSSECAIILCVLLFSRVSSSPCDATRRIMVSSRAAPHDFPPENIPRDLHDAFTRCGQIPTADYYVDDMHGDRRRRQRFRSNQVAAALGQAEDNIARVRSFRGPAAALHKTLWLVVALVAFETRILGSNAAVVGSGSPTEAALLLALGARHVSVIEYLPTEVEHPNITGIRADNWAPAPGEFDVVVSMSSLDHDGLGRYGDPLCPDGDLLTMDMLRAGLAPPSKTAPGVSGEGGLLFLSVPVGPDVLAWNLMRRYGRVRLPLLLEGWSLFTRMGAAFDAGDTPKPSAAVDVAAAQGAVAWRSAALDDTSVHFSRSYEPVLVLMPLPNLVNADGDSGLSGVSTMQVIPNGDSLPLAEQVASMASEKHGADGPEKRAFDVIRSAFDALAAM